MKFFLTMFFIIFLVGCSTKINKYEKPTDVLHEQTLTSTKRVLIKRDLKQLAYITVTHLNEIEQNFLKIDKNSEVFLIGVYVLNSDQKLNDISIKALINDKLVKVKKLEDDAKIVKILSFSRPWSSYFLVKALKDSTKRGVTIEVLLNGVSSSKLDFNDNYGNLPMKRK